MADSVFRTLERDPAGLEAANRMRWRSCSGCGGTGWTKPYVRCACGAPPQMHELPEEVQSVDEAPSDEFLDAQADRWTAIGLATGPTDWELAKAGIRMAYASGNLECPEVWIHLPDPLQGARAVARLIQGETLKSEHGLVSPDVSSVVGAIAAADNNAGSMVRHACYGAHSAYWLGYYETWDKLGLRCCDVRGHMWAAMACGWWWPLDEATVVTDRPVIYEEGVRVVYASGWEVKLK